MLEDFSDFFPAESRAPADWRERLRGVAQLAVDSATSLEACRPGLNDGILEAALELAYDMETPAPDGAQWPRKRIADLCAYMQSTSRLLGRYGIAQHESEAREAAEEVCCAAAEMLVAMEGDYGAFEETIE